MLASFVIGIPQVSGRLRSRRPGWLWVAATLAVALACLVGAASAQARLAQLDPTFGHGGIVQTGVGVVPIRVDVLPDRSILALTEVSAGGHEAIGLARYLPDGSLDHAFGKQGIVTTRVADGVGPDSMTLAPGGKILVVGTAFTGPNGSVDAVAMARYRANGSLDPTFGSKGVVVQSSPSIGREGTSVLVQPDGKILVGGWNQGFMVARYRPTARASIRPSTELAWPGFRTISAGAARRARMAPIA